MYGCCLCFSMYLQVCCIWFVWTVCHLDDDVWMCVKQQIMLETISLVLFFDCSLKSLQNISLTLSLLCLLLVYFSISHSLTFLSYSVCFLIINLWSKGIPIYLQKWSYSDIYLPEEFLERNQKRTSQLSPHIYGLFLGKKLNGTGYLYKNLSLVDLSNFTLGPRFSF